MIVGTWASRPAPVTSPTLPHSLASLAVRHAGGTPTSTLLWLCRRRARRHGGRRVPGAGTPAACGVTGGPPLSCVDRVLHVGVEVEAPGAALPADPRQPGAAERRPQVPDEEAV